MRGRPPLPATPGARLFNCVQLAITKQHSIHTTVALTNKSVQHASAARGTTQPTNTHVIISTKKMAGTHPSGLPKIPTRGSKQHNALLHVSYRQTGCLRTRSTTRTTNLLSRLHVHVLAAPTEVRLGNHQLLLCHLFCREGLRLHPLMRQTNTHTKEGEGGG